MLAPFQLAEAVLADFYVLSRKQQVNFCGYLTCFAKKANM
ncbi:MAG: hypothetical protein ACJARR_000094 [Pseudophaeobacter arcticus]|jgi:hypothetical protein